MMAVTALLAQLDSTRTQLVLIFVPTAPTASSTLQQVPYLWEHVLPVLTLFLVTDRHAFNAQEDTTKLVPTMKLAWEEQSQGPPEQKMKDAVSVLQGSSKALQAQTMLRV